MKGKDYYEILGVSKNTTKDDLKQAYRKLAMQHHPDKAPADKKKESEEKFKEISEAYAVLSNDEKKAQYDRVGSAGMGNVNQEDIFRNADFSDFQDVFSGYSGGFGSADEIFKRVIFGGGIGRQRYGDGTQGDAGEDLEYNLSINLKESAFGTEKEIRFFHNSKCKVCNGTGSKDGSRTVCDKCHGRGAVQIHKRAGFITFTSAQTCPKCHGTGVVIQSPCYTCHGTGKAKEEAKVTVRVPGGVNSGDNLKMTGHGNYGRDGQGDLYIKISVMEDDFFKRKGDDICCNVKIPFILAILGGKIDVQTLRGTTSLNISEGTQPGTTLRMKDLGIHNEMRKHTGDQFVVTEIEIPKDLNERQKNLLIEFDEEMKKSKSRFKFW
ncbi:MAG: molecular chaperone DnaJ [Candidatus Altiarchaeales archaeon A3]|nr:MAG: molecular chaperone DnaJ [Candidatus Altiarchaeales archaeon A3]